MLAAMGGIVGLGLAVMGLRYLTPMIPLGVLPGYVEPELSSSAFLISLVVLAGRGCRDRPPARICERTDRYRFHEA